MRLAAPGVLLTVLLAGCSAPVDTTQCDGGESPFLLTATLYRSMIPYEWLPPLSAMDREGGFMHVRGTRAAGTGLVHVLPGALHGVTEAEVRAALAVHPDADPALDVNVTTAFGVDVPEETSGALCSTILRQFFALKRQYPDDDCLDGATLELTASTRLGGYTSSAYCGGAPPAFEEIAKVVRALEDDGRERFGVAPGGP